MRKYWQDGTLPPAFDPAQTNLNVEEIARRVLTRRNQPVLDFLRAHPRYILSIGSAIDRGAARDVRLAQHFFEEIADRRLHPWVPGVLLLGAHHAAAAPDNAWPTVRMLLEKRGYHCVSLRVLTDFTHDGVPDDQVVPLGTPLDNIQPDDVIRLTALVAQTPVTIPTHRPTGGQPSPFRKVTFGDSNQSVAEQFEYVVLQKA